MTALWGRTWSRGRLSDIKRCLSDGRHDLEAHDRIEEPLGIMSLAIGRRGFSATLDWPSNEPSVANMGASIDRHRKAVQKTSARLVQDQAGRSRREGTRR